PAGKENRACLAQTGSAWSERATLHRAVLFDRPSRKAGIPGKQVRPLFLPVKHDIRCGRPYFCRSQLWRYSDFSSAPQPALADARRSVSAEDRAVSGVRAYRYNQRSRHPRLFVNALSTAASTDGWMARLHRERKGEEVA